MPNAQSNANDLKAKVVTALSPLKKDSKEIADLITQLQRPDHVIPETDYRNVIRLIGLLLPQINKNTQEKTRLIKEICEECCHHIEATADLSERPASSSGRTK